MALKTGRQATDEAVSVLSQLQSGDLQPIPTGDEELDEMLLGGLLPGTVLGIAARSGHGKTHDLENIQRAIMDFDPNAVLCQCNWELELLKLLTRDLAVRTKKTVKDIMFNKPEGDTLETFRDVCDKMRKDNIYFQDEPVSSEVFESDIMQLIENNKDKRIVVTIDNLENVLDTEGSQKASMDKLLKTINVLKKRHPFIAFIVLNQANNNLTERVDNIKRHKPMEDCIYGTDQFFKLCDVVLFKVIPTKLGIYDKYMVFNKERYSWLDEFKIPSTSNSTSFDPFGCVFRFYLKHRRVGEFNVPDLFIERMYTRKDCGLPEVNYNKKVEVPNFSKEEKSTIPIVHFPQSENTSALQSAQGVEFDTDKPF